ncbi:hypothetical protein SMC26_40650 [Actinomadura fulvescens]|uniref:Uncharacterized protein n=1 Tax=Actinomadura fulvescens TaxID=46160 RepID=A0ABN3QYS1_9ACTN
MTKMTQVEATLRREPPGWSIITADRDRWCPTRYPVQDPAIRRLIDHHATALDARHGRKLRVKLGEVER